jgi:hypothetical protein
MTIQEYARAVAEEVFDECYDEWGLEGGRRKQVDLDAIIASVPPPTAQHHAAPTCDGWWWAKMSPDEGEWHVVEVISNNDTGARWCEMTGLSAGLDIESLTLWVGPLLPPDTTEPAPMMRCRKEPHEARGGYLHAEDDDTPYYVDGLRYCGRCHHFLDEGESHRAAPAPVATPTPDIDPEEVRRALEYTVRQAISNLEFAERRVPDALTSSGIDRLRLLREWLRLREQPAPDVQAHCVGCGHAAHALDCSEQGCLCPHSTDVQAYKEMYECGYEAGRDEVQAQAEWCARLPDGSGAAVVSFPLPDNHWLTAEHENVPPMPFRMGTDDPRRTEWKNAIRDAGKYAVRCATMNGADNDFDPDALVQNLVVGMIGYFTPDGFSSDAWANPEQPTPAILTDTDAAVARERERIIELVELKRAKFNIGTRASLALNDVLDQIRARSAKGV